MDVPQHDVLAKDNNPFRFCAICRFYDEGNCKMQYIIDRYGARVNPYWCCDFFIRVPRAMVQSEALPLSGLTKSHLRRTL